MDFVEKTVNLHIKCDRSRNLEVRWCWNLVLRYILMWYKIVPRWSLKFSFFVIIQGIRVQNLVKMAKIWTLTPWKIAKNQNFKNCHTTFLYPNQNKIPGWHYQICRSIIDSPKRSLKTFFRAWQNTLISQIDVMP